MSRSSRPRPPNARRRLRVWSEDVVEAGRALLQSPSYSLPAVASVALGIGAATVICAVFSAVVLRPLPFADEGSLAVVFDDIGVVDNERDPISAVELADYRLATGSVASIAAEFLSETTVTGLGLPRHVNAANCTTNLYETIRVAPQLGHLFSSADEQENSSAAVISHEFWMSALGGAPVIGKGFLMDGLPRTIVGVLRPGEALEGADVAVPMRLTTEQATRRGYRILFAVARLRDGVSVAAAQRELNVIASNARPMSNGRHSMVKVLPLREHLLGNNRPIVQFILVAVCVFLLLSCTNVASLMLTRASVRNHELAVRAALGCSPARLARGSLFEALLIVLVGGAVGLSFAWMVLPVVARTFGDMFANSTPRMDSRVGLMFALTCLITTVGIGLAPALRLSRIKAMNALRQGGRSSLSKRSRRVQELFVCVQVAATVVLLVSAGSLIRSVRALTNINPGFSPDGVVTGRVSLASVKYGDPERMRQFLRRALEAMHFRPSAEVAATSVLPLSGTNSVTLNVEGQVPSADKRFVQERHVTPDYFRVLRTRLLQGRMLSEADSERSERVAIVNHAFVHAIMADAPTLGRRFDDGLKDEKGAVRWITIVGIVDDSRDFGLDAPARPTFFVPLMQDPIAEMSFIVRDRDGHSDRDAAGMVHELRQQMESVDADLPLYDVMTLRERLERSYRSRTVLAYLLFAFASASMLLASIGLFGVTSYSVSQRTQELAIRRAVGASRLRIVSMVTGETSVIIGVGVIGGLLGAMLLSRLITTLLFGIAAADPFSVSIASAIAFSISLLAAFPAAVRAAAVAPLELLKGA